MTNAANRTTGHRPDRHPTPDVVRSLAIGGVILMNYHGYLLLRGGTRRDGWLSDLFDPWTGVFSTRFAATFVLVAGMGVTLMTRSALGDPDRIARMRWRLASRGVVLYAFGLGFDVIWPGSILPFYGAMFAVASLLFTLRTGWIVAVGGAAALGGAAIAWWRVERMLGGHDTSWLTDPGARSIRGLVFDVAVNGTHPLLPWLAFFCAGMAVARGLSSVWFTRLTVAGGLAMFCLATLAHAVFAGDGGGERTRVLASTDPFDRGLLFVASALGTALAATGAIGWLAVRFEQRAAVDLLRRAGQLSLTVYVLHALVFLFAVDTLGWFTPAGIDTALPFAVGVWGAGTIAAGAWQRRFGRGPVEHVYRSITA